jgi:hypothetical protein
MLDFSVKWRKNAKKKADAEASALKEKPPWIS